MRLFGLDDRWTTVDGISVYARISVDGDETKPPIVLIHGAGLSGRYMVPLARRLKANFQVYVPDLPGFGWSGKQRPAVTVQQQAESLERWMDAMGLKRASLLGNSLGSQVAVELAVRNPGRVDKLVLTGCTPDPRARSMAKQYVVQSINMALEPLSMKYLYWIDYAQAGLHRVLQTAYLTVDDPVETRLPSVQAETLIVRGKLDPSVGKKWSEQVARMLPNGRLAVVEGAANCVNYSQAAEVAKIVTAFIPRKELRAARPQDTRRTLN